MPLFGSKQPPTPLAATIEATWVRPQQHKQLRQMESAVRACEQMILAETATESNSLVLVAVTWLKTMGSDGVLVLTKREALLVKKGSIRQQLPLDQVAEASLFEGPQGMYVRVFTRTGLEDFLASDATRWNHGMLLIFPTPGIARSVAEHFVAASPLL